MRLENTHEPLISREVWDIVRAVGAMEYVDVQNITAAERMAQGASLQYPANA
jgi:hypothetical protein